MHAFMHIHIKYHKETENTREAAEDWERRSTNERKHSHYVLKMDLPT
jgi:hypothetical protein